MIHQHASKRLKRAWVALGLLASTFVLLLLFSHPLIHGDGLAHLMYLDSIALDGDLDLSNQALRFGHVNTYQLFAHPSSGELVTAFPFGSAYLLAPWYWLGATLDRLPALQVNAAYFQEHQGVPLAYSLSASFGAMFYMLLAVWLSYDAAQLVTTPQRAAVAAFAGLLGSTALFYATMEPLSTHTYGAFLVSLALWLAVRANTQHLTRGWTTALAIGLVLGFATLVRWQLALYAVAVGAVFAWSAYRGWCRWRTVGAFTFGTGVFATICMWYFWRYFGSPFAIPSESQSGQRFFGMYYGCLNDESLPHPNCGRFLAHPRREKTPKRTSD